MFLNFMKFARETVAARRSSHGDHLKLAGVLNHLGIFGTHHRPLLANLEHRNGSVDQLDKLTSGRMMLAQPCISTTA